jgi:hypothetical protein
LTLCLSPYPQAESAQRVRNLRNLICQAYPFRDMVRSLKRAKLGAVQVLGDLGKLAFFRRF